MEDELDEKIWGSAPDTSEVPPLPIWIKVPCHEVSIGDYIRLIDDVSLGSAWVASGPVAGNYGEDITFSVRRAVTVDVLDSVLKAVYPNGEPWPGGDWKK